MGQGGALPSPDLPSRSQHQTGPAFPSSPLTPQRWLDGKVLDVSGGVCDDGASIIQWPLHGGTNQQWRLEPTCDGDVRIVSRLDGKVLDIQGGTCADGAPIIQWPLHGGANQEWRLVRAK